MPTDLLDLLKPRSGSWPHDGEVAGGADFRFSDFRFGATMELRRSGRPMMTSASPGRGGGGRAQRARRWSTIDRQIRSTDMVSHGFGETRVQNSSKTLVSKKAVALTTLASFI
jgi:hypothetical protein